MEISVVIPSYNRQDSLRRALTSVIRQTFPAREIIVVDDGSTDNTAALIQHQFPQVKCIHQNNHGVSAARNTGIRSASYEWIAFLDSDDEWLPEKLQIIAEAKSQNPQQILFHSDEIWVRHGRRVNPMNKHSKQGGYIFSYCLPLCVISPSAVMIHRSVFETIGMFNENLPACEDYDLWLRLCHRFAVFYIDQPLIIKYGGHEDQLSRKYWGMDRFRIRALHDLMALPSLTAEQKVLVINMLIKKLHILLKGAHKHANREVIQEFQPLLDLYESDPC